MWQGIKEMVLTDKIRENEEVISFYFKSKDGSELVKHKPGQFIAVDINVEDEKYKNAKRTYSLSMKPNEETYRISVKRVEGGLISPYLHDSLEIGDTIKIPKPMGAFVLKENSDKPLVLISAGIGITPLISMLYEAMNTTRKIIFVQAVNNSSVQTFAKELKDIEDKCSDMKSIVFYSSPLEHDIQGKDYDHEGRISSHWISKNLPMDGEFYFCGPPPFMDIINESLLELGVTKENINFEFFGPRK